MTERTVALVGGMLIDGQGKAPIENSAILIRGTTIEKVGQKDNIQLPEGCEVIDVTGKIVMPGMMDIHVHLSLGHLDTPPVGGFMSLPPYLSRPLPWFGITSFAYARLAFQMGFTTLRDVGDLEGGGGGYTSVALRDAIDAGIVEGPRILASGPFLTTTSGHADYLPPWLIRTDVKPLVVDGVDECLKAVRQQVKMKTDWIKILATGGIMDSWDKQEFNDDELKVIMDEAHSKGKLVCAHSMHPEGILAAVKAGLDTVEHGTFLTEEIIELMLKKGTYLVPTLYAPWAMVNQGKKFGLAEAYVESCRVNILEPHMKSFRMAYEAGVKIAMGTDCGFPSCVHGTNALELELMTKYSDMSPMEAIVIATRSSAAALRLEDKVGTIEKGKWADIVVVDGNPLSDIKVLQDKERILLVMKEGKIYVKSF
jgi:imidazolonepropionase-like amidohydrolase